MPVDIYLGPALRSDYASVTARRAHGVDGFFRGRAAHVCRCPTRLRQSSAPGRGEQKDCRCAECRHLAFHAPALIIPKNDNARSLLYSILC